MSPSTYSITPALKMFSERICSLVMQEKTYVILK